MNGAYTIPFFALDQTDAVDPQVASDCVPDSSAATNDSAAVDSEPAGGVALRGVGAQAAAEPSRPSFACEMGHSQRHGGALAWLGIFALACGRRRGRRILRAAATEK
jgi:hypothetical protein